MKAHHVEQRTTDGFAQETKTTPENTLHVAADTATTFGRTLRLTDSRPENDFMSKTNSKPTKRVQQSPARAAVRVQPLVVRVGWAVQIRRQDGSTFFACGSRGVVTPVWNLGNKKYADAFVCELRSENFDAKRVRVDYAEPRAHNDQALPRGGAQETHERRGE